MLPGIPLNISIKLKLRTYFDKDDLMIPECLFNI